MRKKCISLALAIFANIYVGANYIVASPIFLTTVQPTVQNKSMEAATGDIRELIVRLTNVLLSIFCSLVGILAVVHGFSFAKSDDQQQKQQAKQKLTGLVVAFVLVFVLIVLLNTMSDTLIEWVNGVLGANSVVIIDY